MFPTFSDRLVYLILLLTIISALFFPPVAGAGDIQPITPSFHIPQGLQQTNPTHNIQLLPDLAITPRSLQVSPQAVTVGDQVTISAMVENRGKKSLTNVRVRFTCGKDNHDSIINLRAGEKKQISYTLQTNGPAGNNKITIEVNPSPRKFKERNYRNNLIIARIKVKPRAKFPALTGVQPNRLQAGKKYTLRLTGRDLNSAMTLDFGRDIQTRGKITSTVTGSGRFYMIGILVAPNAQSGKRSITLTYKGRRQVQRPTVTIQGRPKKITLQITPSSLIQGKSYSLDIRGNAFTKDMVILFDDGISVTGKVQTQGTTRARVAVKVSATARPGQHTITLQTRRSNSSVTTMDMPVRRIRGTVEVVKKSTPQPYRETPGLAPAAPVSVRKITPSPLILGREYMLNIQGSNFPENIEVTFDRGMQAKGKARVINPGKAIIRVLVAPNARIGRHAVFVQKKQDEVTRLTDMPAPAAKGFVQVKDAPFAPPVLTLPQPILHQSPRMTSMIPNRWVAGKRYRVTVFGKKLAAVTAISFGRDIHIDDLEHQGNSKLNFTVLVDDDIRPSVRIGRISSDSRQGKTALRAWIMSPPKPAKFPPLRWSHEQQMDIRKGAIFLEDPVWHYSGDVANQDHPVPVLNDATVFNWREQTPGLADRFEIRFLTPGGKLIYKKIIAAGMYAAYTTSYKPDSGELMQLFKAMDKALPAGSKVRGRHGLNHKAVTQAVPAGMPAKQELPRSMMDGPGIEGLPGSASAGHGPGALTLAEPNFAPSPEVQKERLSLREQYFKNHGDEINILWQVVGYKKFVVSSQKKSSSKKIMPGNISGQAFGASAPKFVIATDKKQAGEDVEIEISEQWPLRLPDNLPGGVGCDEKNRVSLTVDFRRPDGAEHKVPKIKKDKKNSGQDHNIYVGDTVLLSGSGISITSSPWAVSAKTDYQKKSGQITDAGYSFNNVILDWGDGTWQSLQTEAVPSADNKHTDLPGWQTTDAMNFHTEHVYTDSGKFPIRIFVVPQDQMNQVDSIVKFHRYIPPNQATSAGTGKEKNTEKSVQDLVSTPSPTGSGAMAEMEMPGSRIFMLYCNPLPITIIQDTDATGPLHLASVEITSFSSDDNTPVNTGKFTPANGYGIQKKRGKKQQTQHKNLSAGVATGPISLSASDQKTGKAAITSFGEDTRVSTCEGGLWARGKLHYYGQGYARVQWLVDGVVVKSRDMKIGPSKLRAGLQSSDKSTWGDPLLSDVRLDSPRLPVKDVGMHRMTITVSVIPDPTWSMVNSVAFRKSLASLQSAGKTSAGTQQKTLVPMGGRGLRPSLLPNTTAQGTIRKSWRNGSETILDNLRKVTRNIGFKPGRNMFLPPYSVIAPEKKYLVSKSTGDIPCRFLFPTREGTFEVISLKQLKKQSNSYSGSGKFIFKLPDGPHSVSEHYAPITFDGWQAPDGEEISSGKLTQTLNEELPQLPGMRGTLTGLSGTAGDHVNAIMDMMVSDTTIRLTGAEKPQQWIGVSAPITPEGDWYADSLTLGESMIGWSMTSIESKDVRLDLSHGKGEAPHGNGGTDWVGINLGSATLHPYMFNLADVPLPVTGWNITADGLNGQAETGGFSHVFGEGSIGWSSLKINASHSGLNANYRDFFVEMAWPRIRITGKNTHYSYSPGSEVDVQLGLDGDLPTVNEDYGTIAAVITPKIFQHFDNGWGLMTDTEYSFRDEQGEVFADGIMVNDLLYTIYGTAEYNGQAVPLNIKGQVGGADELISGVKVTAGGKGEQRLGFDFTTEFSMEGIGRAEAPVHNLYGINRVSNRDPWSKGPEHPAEIVLKNHFPETNQAADNEYRVKYSHGSSLVACRGRRPVLLAASSYQSVMSDGWSNTPLLAMSGGISGGGCGNDTFGGHVDTHMFGANTPAIVGTFRFGTNNGSKYWLGFLQGDNLHIPIYADVFIEMIQGGMAYNFDHDAFSRDGGFNACPTPGKGLLFSAGLGVSIAGNDDIKADGVLTIQPADSFYEMLLHAELFDAADLRGRLRYYHSAFDGELWGDINFLSDKVRIHAPEHSTGLHADPDMWFFHVGTVTNPIQGHVMIIDGRVYLMLGNKDEFKIGVEDTTRIDKSSGGFGIAANLVINGAINIGLSPLRLDGRFGGNLNGKFINPIKDIGIGLDADILIGCCSPPHFALGFDVSCCCVKAGATIGLIPAGFSPWAECSCCPW